MEYEKINLNPQKNNKHNCGCKQTKDYCDCNNKINLKSNCTTPEYFLVNNYFSELVHEWEKETARYNLGILELEGIEYITEDENLTKVIFKYRKGHELITREFICSPKGDKGDKGDTGIQGPKGDRGDVPVLGKVVLHWIDNCDEEHGEFSETTIPNRYNLDLYLRQPNTFNELSRILDEINNTLTSNYVTRQQLEEILSQYSKTDYSLSDLNLIYNQSRNSLLLRYKNLNLGDVIYLNIPEYTLSANTTNNSLNLLKDGQIQSTVLFSALGGLKGDSIDIYYVAYSETTPPAPGLSGAPSWGLSIPITSTSYPYIWMAIRKNLGLWNVVRLTGDPGKNGINGTDGSSGTNTAIDYDGVDFIFLNTIDRLNNDVINSLIELINADTNFLTISYPTSGRDYIVNNKNYKITGNASGISDSKPYEYIGIRIKTDGKFVLGTLTLWSVWGKSGKDGAYVEYIYGRFKSKPTWIRTAEINPESWISRYKDEFEVDNYFGPQNLGTDPIDGHWYDNPIDPTSTYKYVYCSSRKYNGETFESFCTPALWSVWVDVEKGNSDIILTGDLPVITYDILADSTDIPNVLHLTAYNGNSELTILKYQYNEESWLNYNYDNGITLTTLLLAGINNTSLRNAGTYKHTFTVEIELPLSLQSTEVTSTYRTYTVIETVITNGITGSDGVSYKLLVEPSAITFNDNDTLVTSNIHFQVLKNGSEIDYGSDETWLVTINCNLNTRTITCNKGSNRHNYNIGELLNSGLTLSNGNYFTLALRINNVLWDLVRIPVLKNSLRLVSKYIVRNRGLYDPTVTYRGIDLETSSSDIKYVDVTYTVGGTELERKENYYMCHAALAFNKNPDSPENQYNNGSGYWDKIYTMDLAYIKTIIAKVISTESLLAKEVLILKDESQGSNIVAGMTSGNKINNVNEDGWNVRIWAGTSTECDANGLIKSADLKNAPFRVYQNGNMVATNAEIIGDITLTSLTLKNSDGSNVSYYENEETIDIYPEDADKHKIIYIFTGTNLTTVVPKGGCSIIIKVNNVLQSYSEEIELNANSVYILINTSTGWRLTLLDCVNKIISETTLEGWIFKPLQGTVSIVDPQELVSSGLLLIQGTSPSFDNSDLPSGVSAQWTPGVNSQWSDLKRIYLYLTGIFTENGESLTYKYELKCLSTNYTIYQGTTIRNAYEITLMDSSITPSVPQDLSNFMVLFEVNDIKYPDNHSISMTSYTEASNALSNALNISSNAPGLSKLYTYTVVTEQASVLPNGTVYGVDSGEVLGYIDNIENPQSAVIYNTSGKIFNLEYNDELYPISAISEALPVTDLEAITQEAQQNP